jgi:hypothetical protein
MVSQLCGERSRTTASHATLHTLQGLKQQDDLLAGVFVVSVPCRNSRCSRSRMGPGCTPLRLSAIGGKTRQRKCQPGAGHLPLSSCSTAAPPTSAAS